MRTEDLSDLIGRIYDCSLDPDLWTTALTGVTAQTGCIKAIVSLNDLHTDQTLIHCSVGWEPNWLARRATYTAEIHAAVSGWLNNVKPPLDHPFIASRDIPSEIREKIPYVIECLRPQGIGDVLHCFLMRTGQRFSETVLFSEDSRGPMAQEQVDIAVLLAPHLRRAVAISNALDAQRLRRAEFEQSLEAMSCAIFFADQAGHVLHCNAAGRKMLQAGKHITLHQGRLHAPQVAAANRELLQSLAADRRPGALGRLGLSIHLTDREAPPILAHVLPLHDDGVLGAVLDHRAVGAIFVRAGAFDTVECERFAAAFRLTPGESRVASAILCGQNLTEAAQQLGLARSTVKTHLEGVYDKTGVSRQAELVRLAMTTLVGH